MIPIINWDNYMIKKLSQLFSNAENNFNILTGRPGV